VYDDLTYKFLNIGHRGAPEAAPENTLPSFLKALELGANGIELDVTLSKDGAIVVFHNYLLHKTTDGRGLLANYTLRELQSLDAGSFFSADYANTYIPTLEEVIEAVGEDTFVMIEIKANPFAVKGVEKEVARFVKSRNLYHRVVISSFSPLILKRVGQFDSRVSLGVLHVPIIPSLLNRCSFKTMTGAGVLHPLHGLVKPGYLNQARKAGAKVIPWTVNRKEDMEKMMELGVDGLITDHPEVLGSVLQERNKS